MNERSPVQVTELLMEWSNGGRGALDRLIPLVYDELHRLSARQLKLSASIIHEVAAIHVIHSSAPQMRFIRRQVRSTSWSDSTCSFCSEASCELNCSSASL